MGFLRGGQQHADKIDRTVEGVEFFRQQIDAFGFPDCKYVFKRLTDRLDWSEATVEDEYDAALAAFDIVCGRPASRRSRAA